MSRILLDLPDEQVQRLTSLADAQQRSRATVLREAIAVYLHQQCAQPAPDVFGAWQNRQVDGLETQRALREEW